MDKPRSHFTDHEKLAERARRSIGAPAPLPRGALVDVGMPYIAYLQ